VVQEAAAEDVEEKWLWQSKTTWQIGDNVEYQSQSLRIRDVNKLMLKFIFQHFENPSTSTTQVCSVTNI
jgi:hypothetical protein